MTVLETLAAPARHEATIRKSRFIAHATPLDDPDDAARCLAAVRAPDASHHCWAYRVGEAYRWSDDGEPAGTAGRPLLAAIDGQHCDRTMVVVARWFGGIRLGAGGLVRAYGGTAAECLRLAGRVAIVARVRLDVACELAHVGALHQLIARFGATRNAESFVDGGVRMAIELPRDRVEALQSALRDATRGQARIAEATP